MSRYYDLMPNFLVNHSPIGGSYNYAYYLLHPWKYIGELFDNTKWFIQRGRRGYADCDVWNLDGYLTKFLGNALRDLANQVHGTVIIETGRKLDPLDPNDVDLLTVEEWQATLRYIAETFDIGRKMQACEYDSIEEHEAANKRFQHGMRMFSEYFLSLWD